MEIWPVLVLIGGLIALDTTAGPQVMVSEPLVSGTLLGLLFGMPETGVLLGMLFQLLWLGYMPLGAVRFTDHNMAAFVATASVLAAARVYGLNGELVRAAVLPATLFGILIGSVGLRLTDSIRYWSDTLSDRAVAELEAGSAPRIAYWHYTGMGVMFLKGAGMTILFVPAGFFVCGLVRHLPTVGQQALSMGSLLIIGTVAASALRFYWLSGQRRYLLLGSLGGVAWFLLVLIRGN